MCYKFTIENIVVIANSIELVADVPDGDTRVGLAEGIDNLFFRKL